MAKPRILIAGPHSGSGKTTVTLGLMAALRSRGLTVQGFKCGPDYIDPTYHAAITGRPARNLDSWMAGRAMVPELFVHGCAGADVSVIEGVMGFLDGKDPLSDLGSTADLARILDCPVAFVVNASGMARSAAAIVRGFQTMAPDVRFAGVIVNEVGSAGHYALVQAAVERECGIPALGWLPRIKEAAIPERHLGLVPAIERGELQPLFDMLAERTLATVDVDRLLAAAADAPELKPQTSLFAANDREDGEQVTIAVARDAAFHFYYPENLELLEAYGARLQFFSPLAGEPVPVGADGLYIGGGFPEEFAKELSASIDVRESIRRFAGRNLPILAECGGYMYLAERLTALDGITHEMVGLVPGTVTMHANLQALGYREIVGERANTLLGAGGAIRGHEFHYSSMLLEKTDCPAYCVRGYGGEGADGYAVQSVTAGYSHLYFPSNPEFVRTWIRRCREAKLREVR